MKKSRFSEEQVVKILREADRSPVAEVAKRHGVVGALAIVTGRAWAGREAVPAAKICLSLQSIITLAHLSVPALGHGLQELDVLALVEDVGVLLSAGWI
jgi:hypothetical protein